MTDKRTAFLKSIPEMPAFTDIPLSDITSFRIGGPASVVVSPQSEQELCAVLKSAEALEYPYKIIGFGSNILAPDEGYPGIVIRFFRPFFEAEITGCTVRCSAGDSLAGIARKSISAGLSGMEGLAGIPGSIGGACAMNAGAYGAEMKQILSSVRIMRNGEIFDTEVSDGDMGVRKSVFSAPDTILLSATLTLCPDDGNALERMNDFMQRRKEKQPLDLPSAGSVFKRPKGHFAGQLIEQCGLKGASVGDARVSTKHAGFIVNTGRATSQNVSSLVRLIQDTVFRETGVTLERELKYWNEV
ncbi:MAG: UDP-N-acetylmuramate dehydrogenase [Clostridiales bacterium]|nr:UDP-N-acetylmuramate dehydrogenase [Clostridiales bacterium]